MTTFLLRHASTSYSSRHQVNGDSSLRLPLNEEGVAACHQLRDSGTLSSARTWITSVFPRAQQTAVLLAGATQRAFRVDSRLNEIDYGDFEGGPFLDYAAWLGRHGPWRRPPGSAESQREAFPRMLTGLRDALVRPGPRVIVAHGLVLSLVTWALSEAPGSAVPLFFPEAPCVEPLVIADARLHRLTARLLDDVGADRTPAQPTGGDRPESRQGGMPVLATFDPLRNPPEERSPHA
jgi:2,3-bisphosphoglycerate-dependent phosphoglycerate mutase